MFLYAIIGGDRKILFSDWLFLISDQCLRIMPLILFMSSEKYVTKTSLSDCWFLSRRLRASALPLKGISLMWLMIWLCLYPLCLSLCISFSCIVLKVVSLELVLRYLFDSPLAMALRVVGG